MDNFAYYELARNWPEAVVAFNELETRLRTAGRPVAADIVLHGFQVFREDLVRLGREVSTFATEELKRQEHDTRVRPDTLGGGGPRLGEHLVAEPLAEGLLPGSIGVANEDTLDKAVPWWSTNEEGSSARVGGHLYGLFYGDSGSPPSSDEFREHALFAPAPSAAGGGLGIIENPIPARRFILKSIPAINARWEAGFQAAKQRMSDAMDKALATRA